MARAARAKRRGSEASATSGDDAPPPSPTVLLIIDVINDLEWDGGRALLAPGRAMARRIAALRTWARAAGMACVYVNDNWGRWRADWRELVAACRGTTGWPIVQALAPRPDDYFVLKPRHSAFHATPLEFLLDRLQAERLIITGIAADNCVLFTASDAYLREYELAIPSDCAVAEKPAWHAAAMRHMARVLKADVRPAAKVMADLTARRAS
jgi:nicotinamidase-related amidase